MRTNRTGTFLIFFGAAVLVSALLAACSNESSSANQKRVVDDTVPVTVAKVELVPMDRTLTVVGTLVAKDEATIGAEVEGRVEKTMAEFGDRFAAGQEIAQVDIDSYEAQAAVAAANLTRAKASAVNAEQNLKRTQSLHVEKIAADSDYDKDIAAAEQAKAEVKAAEAAQAISDLNLKRSHVRAPFDCAVADRIASVGDYVKVGAPLFRVVNDSQVKFMTQVPEAYAHEVQKGQAVQLTVDDWPTNTFEGKVYLISPQVNTATRDFPIAALVDNLDHRLRANAFARGKLILQQNVPTPTVPVEAIINFAGVTRLYVAENGIARSRTITVGRVSNGRQEVLSGLKAGEQVVVTGQTKLHDGGKIRIKTEVTSNGSESTTQQ